MLSLSRNPARYVAYTVLYHARAYYPILAILFIDLGLTLDQFVLLNLIWALTIFVFEVPSGAMAGGVRKSPGLSVVTVKLTVCALSSAGPGLMAVAKFACVKRPLSAGTFCQRGLS